MTEKRYAVNVLTILGISVVLMLFFFRSWLTHHHDIPDRVRQDRGALRAPDRLWLSGLNPLVGHCRLFSAETQTEPVKIAVAASSPPGRDGQQVHQAARVVCHDAGMRRRAPKLGDKGQWANRIAEGPRHSTLACREWHYGERGSDAGQRREPGAEQRRGQGRRRLHAWRGRNKAPEPAAPAASFIAGRDILVCSRFTR